MHKDCIILCHSTDVNGNLHCLQEINGKPFIFYVASYLKKFHICKVIFSIGTQKEKFKEYVLGNRDDFSFAYDFAEQDVKDSSGQAILHALQYSDTPDVLIMNGHQSFDVNIDELIAWQQTKMGDVTAALSYQQNTDKHIIIQLNEDNMMHQFTKGDANKHGLVLGGIYCMFRPSFLNINFPHKFDFVDDFIQKHYKERDFIGMISEGYFLDISQDGAIEKAIKDFPIIFGAQESTNA